MNSSPVLISLITIQKIALCLEGAWKVEEQDAARDSFRADMIREDGFTIHVYAGEYGYKDKVKFSFVRPRHHTKEYVYLYDNNNRQVDDPLIRCSASKSFDKLVNDLIGRFMPDAENIFIRALQAIKQQKESYDRKNKSIEDICATLGVQPEHGTNKEYRTHYVIPDTYHTVDIHYDSSIKLTLNSLSADKAAQVIQFLKSL